jgi:hypothetical protein
MEGLFGMFIGLLDLLDRGGRAHLQDLIVSLLLDPLHVHPVVAITPI